MILQHAPELTISMDHWYNTPYWDHGFSWIWIEIRQFLENFLSKIHIWKQMKFFDKRSIFDLDESSKYLKFQMVCLRKDERNEGIWFVHTFVQFRLNSLEILEIHLRSTKFVYIFVKIYKWNVEWMLAKREKCTRQIAIKTRLYLAKSPYFRILVFINPQCWQSTFKKPCFIYD